jgi:predicted ATPase
MTDRFLLKSVAIENFKAVRRSGTVKLTPLTVFIGDNGSGKSSLIEALETYRAIVLEGLDAAMERWRRFDDVWNKRSSHRRKATPDGGGTYENPVSFRMKGVWRRGGFRMRLEVCPEVGGNKIRIEKESIELPDRRIARRNSAGECESQEDAGLSVRTSLGPNSSGVSRPTRPRVMVQARRTTFLPGESASPADWKALVRRWQFLSLVPDPMGTPTRQRMTGGPPMLERDGSNPGQYLWSLREASVDAFNGLLEALQYVLPYAKDVQPTITHEIERQVFLEMAEADFKVPGWVLSTGTLRILALLACLRHPDPPPLLVVEEVENGLDPRALHLLVEEFRAALAAKKTQILVTTHSPYLLDLLDLSHIVVVERVDGEPTFRRPDKARLAEWSTSFAPGRLYTMGRLTRES